MYVLCVSVYLPLRTQMHHNRSNIFPFHSTAVSQMAKGAILALKERNGSSVPAIKKHIEATYPDLTFLPHQLRSALKKGTEAGMFIKVRATS